jgi:hypothetical protein
MNVEQNSLLLYGRGYTPDYDTTRQARNLLRCDEMTQDMVSCVQGLPVLIEHDPRYVVGSVVGALVDFESNLNVFLHITGNDVVTSHLRRALDIDASTGKPFFTGFSMGTEVTLDMSTRCFTTVKSVMPKEMSVVAKPDQPGCLIDKFWEIPPGIDVSHFVATESEKMDNLFIE